MATRYCTSCGQPIIGDGRFCTNCGATAPAQPDPQPQYQQPQYQQPQQPYQQPQQPYQQPQQPYQQPQQQYPMGSKPKNYMVLAILSTILCCIPVGICSIIQAARVNKLWDSGQYQEAEEASQKAKKWAIASAILGIVGGIIYAITESGNF